MTRLLRYGSLAGFGNWVVDNPVEYYTNQGGDVEHTKQVGLDIQKVQPWDSVFVKTDLLPQTFNKLAQINVPWHLITGNSDLTVNKDLANAMLSLPNIVSWTGNNLPKYNNKNLQVPIGIASSGVNSPNTFLSLPEKSLCPRPIQMCLTPLGNTHPDRQEIKNWLQKNCYHVESHLNWQGYQDVVAVSKFSICPRGNGIDTHRVMEAILLGAVPVVMSCCLDEMYNHMQCKIIYSWQDLLQAESWPVVVPNPKLATFDYWFDKFEHHKIVCQNDFTI